MPTITELNAEIDAQLPTNAVGQISASRLRTVLHDMTNSLGSAGGSIVASGNPVFETYADARAAITAGIDASVKSFWTSGFYTAGDNGSSFYVDIGSVDIVDNPALFSFPVSALVVGEPAYIHDTINNRYFLMTPKNGEVWVEQFGAQAPGWLTAGSNLTDYLYKAQRYCIKTNFYTKQWGTITVRIGPGFWYQSSTFTIKGLGLHVKGSGNATSIQPAVGITGIFVAFQYTFAGDGSCNGLNGWQANQNYQNHNVSDGTTRYLNLGQNGNVYKLITAGTSASSGIGPSGTGSNITDGTAHWQYLRPLLPDEEYNSTDGGGTTIEDLSFYSHWNNDTDPIGYACGILSSAHTVTFRNITADNMSAHGLAHIANGDVTFPHVAGNADAWRVENCTCFYNGWSGIRIGYSIANAGHGFGIDTSTNGWYGIDDGSFLMSNWTDVQSAFDGRPSYGVKRYSGQVVYNGRWYTARIPIGGYDGPANYQETPGVSTWWIYDGGDGTWTADAEHPTWSNTGIYEPGGGYAGHDLNSRSFWSSVYIEQGTMPSQFGINHTVMGILAPTGALTFPTQGNIFADGAWIGNRKGLSCTGGFIASNGTGRATDARFGPTNSPQSLNIAYFADWDGNGLVWEGHSGDGVTNLNYNLKNNSLTIWDILGANSAKTFGGSSPLTNVIQFPQFVLGDDTNGMGFTAGTAAPTSGYWVKGTRVFNKNYTAGGVSEWVCTVSGTPGTWVGLKPAN